MASPAGIEPTTPSLGNLCSIQLSYGDTLNYDITALQTGKSLRKRLNSVCFWPLPGKHS